MSLRKWLDRLLGKEEEYRTPGASPVIARLNRRNETYLKLVSLTPTSELEKKLTDNILELMFNISQELGGSLIEADPFEQTMRQQEDLRIHCRTFYLYYPSDMSSLFYDIESRLEERVYGRLVSYYRQQNGFSGLKELVNRELRDRSLNWDGLNDKQQGLHNHVFGCWVRAFVKEYGSSSKQAYMIGRQNFYYLPALEKFQAQENKEILLAAKIKLKADGSGSLNMHNPIKRDPENLHITDQRETWELTIGCAEHDNVIIPDFGDQREVMSCKNVRWNNGWMTVLGLSSAAEAIIGYEQLGHRSPYLEYVKTVSEAGYTPNIRPQGRVLPSQAAGEVMNLRRNPAVLGALERGGVPEDSLQSALEIEPGECWLAAQKTNNGMRAWICNISGTDWVCEQLLHRQSYSTSKNSYVWRDNNESAPLPDCFVGELEFAAGTYKSEEIAARKGHEFVIGRKVFDLSDRYMSEKRQFTLRSDGRDEARHALYFVEPNVGAPTPEFYLIHRNIRDGPLLLRYAGANNADRTQIKYAGQTFPNVELDANGRLPGADGEALRLWGEGIIVVCGTTTFKLETSSSVSLEAAAASEAYIGATRSAPVGWGSIENVESCVRKYPSWENADVRKADKEVQGTYSEGYLVNRDDRTYFAKCYKTDLRVDEDTRIIACQEVFVYEQCKGLPVVPELIAALPNNNVPQVLLMKKLRPLNTRGFSLVEILAIGYAMATLLERLDSLKLVHCDIRETKICIDPEAGQLQLIDYNGVFPALGPGQAPGPLHRWLARNGLPSDLYLAPEHYTFRGRAETGRIEALRELIGTHSGLYSLGTMLLSFRNLDAETYASQWAVELPGSDQGNGLEDLFRRMLADEADKRATIDEVKEGFETALRSTSEQFGDDENVRRAKRLLGVTLSV